MKRVMMSIVAAAICGGAFAGEPVKYRGLFINDEDWGLRPWANRHFHEDGIGVSAYKKIFALMKSDGLNLMWPAMHPGGYEFVSRPENMALAAEWGIRIGTSHCEPMLRNNIYIAKEDKKKYNWEKSPEWVRQHWQWSVDRYATNDVLWTVGMRGIHDGPMSGGTTQAEKIALLEDVLKAQFAMLPKDAPKLFIPYKEVLSLYNAGLKVPNDDGNTTIMWVNDNYGYIRRLGGPQTEGFGGGIYYHVSYHGWPHSYCHICTTPPALAWYELVQKCANNNVRDVWMINAGDVFQAEILLYSIGKFAEDPDYWMTRPDPQTEVLAMWVDECLLAGGQERQKNNSSESTGSPVLHAKEISASLREKIVSHLNEYYNLGFIRKPEHMKIGWTKNLPEELKASLIARYEAFLAEDAAIEKELGDKADEYFRTAGYAAQFLANAGIIHLKGLSQDEACIRMNALDKRYDEIFDGEWSGFWMDTVDHAWGKNKGYVYENNSWSSLMQWPWFEPKEFYARNAMTPTSYTGAPEPKWIEPIAITPAEDGSGEFKRVPGLGTSGNAFALLPVKPDAGYGSTIEYDVTGAKRMVVQFLPTFALWPGLDLEIQVCINKLRGAWYTWKIEVPVSTAESETNDPIRQCAVEDNFVRVEFPLPEGATNVTFTAIAPGIVIDKVGVK